MTNDRWWILQDDRPWKLDWFSFFFRESLNYLSDLAICSILTHTHTHRSVSSSQVDWHTQSNDRDIQMRCISFIVCECIFNIYLYMYNCISIFMYIYIYIFKCISIWILHSYASPYNFLILSKTNQNADIHVYLYPSLYIDIYICV